MTSLLNIAGNIPVSGVAAGQSLRFEDGDSAYLSWTPASAGNRKTWTWSAWVKRGNLGIDTNFMIEANSGNGYNRSYNYFNTSDQLIIGDYATSWNWQFKTTQVFRDVGAWYHIVVLVDTTQATSSDRVKLYINGEQVTSFATANYPSLNYTTYINSTYEHTIGYLGYAGDRYFDGYLSNVTFIDGQALDPTSFGEYQDTLWKPKSDADITSLTFGTNGFYLPFKQTTEAEGFSTVTYTGNGGTQSIEGVGFEPDFVWIKIRNGLSGNNVFDSVRGATKRLYTNGTAAEDTLSGVTSFDTNGFTLGSALSGSGESNVAWAWDAGTGSPVSNTDGSITSTVKANAAKGFSIVTWTGNGTSGQVDSVGHGLSQPAEIYFTKQRNATRNWFTFSDATGSWQYGFLDTTAALSSTGQYSDATELYLSGTSTNQSGGTYVAYCFHSVSGYSSIGSYTGDGTSNGSKSINLGFKPAFVMIKRTNATENWMMLDTTRNPYGIINNNLYANLSNAESDYDRIEATATGFDIYSNFNDINASGSTYIYLAFADTRDATFFGDISGNGNNWTPNKLNNTDVVPDSPVTGGNFATLNPLARNQNNSFTATLSEGNLKHVTTTDEKFALSTIEIPRSDKWYIETLFTSTPTASSYNCVGVLNPSTFNGNYPTSGGSDFSGAYDSSSTYTQKLIQEGSVTATTITIPSGTIIGLAIDASAETVAVYKNGSLVGTVSYDSVGDTVYAVGNYANSSITNFGQDSSFAGNATPQGNTDDNGVGDFYYAPPSGFLALTTGNLPTPSITAPDDYFNTVLWTGDATYPRSITGVNFQPNLIWAKARNQAYGHLLQDSVRGTGSAGLYSNSSEAEGYYTDNHNITSFDADGFTLNSTVGTDVLNGSGVTNVAWNWKAGGTAVSNTDGSITSQVSANVDAGFSIVSYTGNATSGATVGHGLSSAPDLIIVKNRDTARNWTVYNSASGATKYLLLNTTNADQTGTSIWNDTAPTSSVFSVGTSQNVNYAEDYIAYCFHSVEGYSKIGSYTGSASLPFVHCGFRPAFIMIKCTSGTSNWLIRDVKRDTYNQSVTPLAPNLSAAESSFSPTLNETDILSNGFKLRDNYGDQNGSGQTYIFIAFASAPFKSANAR